jgi:hypothetical protein
MLCSSRIKIDVDIYIGRVMPDEHCLNENQLDEDIYQVFSLCC